MSMASRRTAQPRAPRESRPFRWTRAHLSRLPNDGNRYEVLNGALLVTPQARPEHQVVAMRLAVMLSIYCDAHRLGWVVGPGAIVWRDNELQPDVLVTLGPVPPLRGRKSWRGMPQPGLVIEVLSPGSERYDLGKKREAYLARGVPEYWVVDIEEAHIDVFRPDSEGAERTSDSLEWSPAGAAKSLKIDLGRLLT